MMSDTLNGNAPRKREKLLGYALMFVCILFVRLIFLEAPYFSDDTAYLSMAADYSSETVRNAFNQSVYRLGMLVPLMLLDSVFGYSVYTYYIFSIGVYLLMIGAVFVVARSVDGVTAAVIATCIMSTSALVLAQSSNVFPDFPNLVFLLFSFAVFLRAARAESGWGRAVGAAALLGFIAYLVRAPNTIWLLCIPLYELITRRSIKRSMLYGGVFAALLVAECLYYGILLGDPLARITKTFGGVASWSVNMPVISPSQYLLDPWRFLFTQVTGVVLLFGGVAGIILAVWRRNWKLICLTIGGLVLFCAYAYTATSLEPLRRALPLYNRYFIAFMAVLAVNAGYVLSHVIEGTLFAMPRPLWRRIGVAAVVIIVGLQVAELPTTVTGQRAIRNDRFYHTDQILGNPRLASQINGTVYAWPGQAFRFYSNAKKFDIQNLRFVKPAPDGHLLLYSRAALGFHLNNNIKRRNDVDSPMVRGIINRYNYYLEHHPDWDYLLDTGDLVLARVGGPLYQGPMVLDLTDPVVSQAAWVVAPADESTNPVRIETEDSTVVFHLPANAQRPLQFHTFEGPWAGPVTGSDDVFRRFRRANVLESDLVYTLNADVGALMLLVVEFDERQQLSSKTFHLPRVQGRHAVKKIFALHEDTRSFRVVMRAIAEEDAVLTFDQFDVLGRADAPVAAGPVVLDLTDRAVSRAAWRTAAGVHDKIRIQTEKDATVFFLSANSQGPLHAYTFEGPWASPAVGWDAVFEGFPRAGKLESDLVYTLSEDVKALMLVVVEYGERWQLSSRTFNLPRTQGRHEIRRTFALNRHARSFRVMMRVRTQDEAVLAFNRFNIRTPQAANARTGE